MAQQIKRLPCKCDIRVPIFRSHAKPEQCFYVKMGQSLKPVAQTKWKRNWVLEHIVWSPQMHHGMYVPAHKSTLVRMCTHTQFKKEKEQSSTFSFPFWWFWGPHYGLICPTTMTLAPNVKTYKPLVLFKKYNCVKPYVYNYVSYFSRCCDLISNYSNLRKERFLLAHSWEYMAL